MFTVKKPHILIIPLRMGIWVLATKKGYKNMSAINNVRLTIGSENEEIICLVVVKYTINFSNFEVQAKTVFIENVTLYRSNQILDNQLITLKNSCVLAENSSVDRCITTEVPKRTLKEDWEFSVYGSPIHRANNTIYACVKLTHFNPGNTQSYSNVVDENMDVRENSTVHCIE